MSTASARRSALRHPGPRSTSTTAVVVALSVVMLVAACTTSSNDGSTDPSDDVPSPNLDAAWRMHAVDWRFKGANGLGPGDVNGDGYTDYVTNYESDQRYVVQFHPGEQGDVTQPWPTVEAFAPDCADPACGVNPENAVLADLDGDGALDIAAAQGYSEFPFWEGSQPGLRVIWGPPPPNATDPDAWEDGGLFPATDDDGHYHFLRATDVNRDGAIDVVAGGRVHAGNGSVAGLLWMEAPVDPAQRRDLSAWQRHDIAPTQTGGRNFVFHDIDDDGDEDIVVANADFDTAPEDEGVFWYENPGSDAPDAQRATWPEHEIYRGSEFHTKAQIAVADLNDDGATDLLVHLPESIYWFRKISTSPVEFELVRIDKDPSTTHLARSLRVADLDGDGRLDLVGGFAHENGTLPHDKAALFWMSYDGDQPAADNWTTRVITWGAGHTGDFPEFGEKWDLIEVVDLDGDGDLDLLANNEEWWEDAGAANPFWAPHPPAVHAVVWFENRLNEPPQVVTEDASVALVEAEWFTDDHDGTWTSRTAFDGYGGDGYAQAVAVLSDEGRAGASSTGRAYDVELTGGTYTIEARLSVPARWGKDLGGDRSDSALLGGIGQRAIPIAAPPVAIETWATVDVARDTPIPPGRLTLTLQQVEGGLRVDWIRLRRTGD